MPWYPPPESYWYVEVAQCARCSSGDHLWGSATSEDFTEPPPMVRLYRRQCRCTACTPGCWGASVRMDCYPGRFPRRKLSEDECGHPRTNHPLTGVQGAALPGAQAIPWYLLSAPAAGTPVVATRVSDAELTVEMNLEPPSSNAEGPRNADDFLRIIDGIQNL